MRKMTKKEINDTYELIVKYHEQYLEKKGVKLPKLYTESKKYTKNALTLVYLAFGYPNTDIVSKQELTEFIQEYYPDVLDVQQARHLGAQNGWYILSGTRNDNDSETINPGQYKLKTLELCYPGFTAERRLDVTSDDYWENLKKQYDYRCACCGSKQGEPHRYWKNTTTVLQKGHKDPSKPLEPGNIIPQCEKCNRPDRNYWIYDDKGRVVALANEKVIDHCSLSVQKAVYIRLFRKFKGKKPEDL